MKHHVTSFTTLLVVALGSLLLAACDDEAAAPVPNPAEPPPMAGTLSREEGEKLAKKLLAGWEQRTGKHWTLDEREAHELKPAFDNTYLLTGGQREGQTYGRYTKADVELWKRETEKLALMGSRIFHDGAAMGGTNGVSCDMCHPHGANTHAETYPKFQTQMGRVVLLRDMVNWCLTNPVRAPSMNADDPRMRALEAYLHAQASGKTMTYGKQ